MSLCYVFQKWLMITVSIFSAFLLFLMIPTSQYIYGSLEDNQSLVGKYGNTTEKIQMEREKLETQIRMLKVDCTEDLSTLRVDLFFIDKCKPIIKAYELQGWYVDNIQKSRFDEKKDTISLTSPTWDWHYDCVLERFKEHTLLLDEPDSRPYSYNCQKVIQYYLDNGYDLVDKYDNKVELIQNNSSLSMNK